MTTQGTTAKLSKQKAPPDSGVIKEVIASELIQMHYQPLVFIQRRNVMGLEALARGIHPVSGELIPPHRLFSWAGLAGLLPELDRLCRRKALEGFRDLHHAEPDMVISINFEPSILDQGTDGHNYLLDTVDRLDIDRRNVLIEIVESRVGNGAALREFVETYRGFGFMIGLDDMGAGHSNLDRIAYLRPDVMKLDRTLIKDLPDDFYKQEVVRSMLAMCRKIGSLAVAEGVENDREALVAMDLGARVLQGFGLARPHPDPVEVLRACAEPIDRIATSYQQYKIDKVEKSRRRSFTLLNAVGVIADQLKAKINEDLDLRLREVICQHPNLECLYVLDARGKQKTRTIFNMGRWPASRKLFFQPAIAGEDMSLKDYFLLIKAGLENYVSEPYVSAATGDQCVTVSTRFKGADGMDYILCADFEDTLGAT